MRLPQLLLFSLIAILAITLLPRLTEVPSYWYDEAVNLLFARTIAETGRAALSTAPHSFYPDSYQFMTSGYPLSVPLALLFNIFGFSIALARGYMLFWILLFLIVAYLLLRRWVGEWRALGGAFLLTAFPPFIFHGMSVIGEIPGLMFIALGLLLLDLFFAHRRVSLLSFAGISFGLAVATKPLFAPLLLAIPVGLFLSPKRFPPFTPREWVFALLSLVLPILVAFFILLPPGSGFRGLLEVLSTYGGRSAQHTRLQNILQNLRGIAFRPSFLYTVLAGAIGFGVLVKKRFDGFSPAQWIALVFTLLMALFFLQSVGWGRYFLTVQVAALLMAPAALAAVFRPTIAAAAITFLCGAQLVYALTVSELKALSGPHAQELAEFLQVQAPEGNVYVIDAFEVAALFPTARRYHYFRFEGREVVESLLPRIETTDVSYLIADKKNEDLRSSLEVVREKFEETGRRGNLVIYRRKF